MATPPVQHNLHRLAERLRPGRKAFCVWFGDSTGAQNNGGATAQRWGYGVMRRWPITNWSRFVAKDGSTSADEGQSSIAMNLTGKAFGATLTDGATTNPFCNAYWDQAVNGTGGTHAATLGRRILQNLNNYRFGDWTAGQTLLVRGANTAQTGGWTTACPIYTVALSAGGTEGPTYLAHSTPVWSGSVGARSFTDFTIVRGSGAANTITFDVHNHAASNLIAGFYKTLYAVQNTTTRLGIDHGFGWASISEGGWNMRNQIDGYSNDALTWEIATFGYNTFFIQMGINVAPGESASNLPTATYEANYREFLAKLRTCIAAAGVVDPLIILVTPWQCGGPSAFSYQTAQSLIHNKIAREQDDMCHWSVDSAMRIKYGEGWFGADGTPWLGDTIHAHTTGALEFADLFWEWIQRARATYRRRLILPVRMRAA